MNKLLVDIQTYCTISSKLSALSSKLESLSAQLSGIELSQEAGSNLQLALSSIRFSLIGTSLADEIAELAIKRVARVTKSTAAEAADLRLRILSAVDMLESGEQELVARINDLCTDASEWEQRQGAASAVSAWQQELDINHITKAFDLVSPPDGQPSITTAEKLRDNGVYQFWEGAYSAVTGDWSNMVQSDATREQYLIQSVLSSCTDANSALDESAALSMAQAYMHSGDESMQNAGQYLYKYLNSDAATQAIMRAEDKLISYANGKVQSTVYEMVTEAIPGPISTSISETKKALDFSMNTSNNASLTNNLIYSAEAARTMYDAFQSDYAAYKADPSDANLERAMASYSAYNRAISNSYEAYADYTANTTDSFVGKIFSSEAAQRVDEEARFISSSHQNMARDMDAERSTRTT